MPDSEPQVILITGGVRSGKSGLAERLAKVAVGSAGDVVYVATSRILDDEMAARVARHRARRPKVWRTVEEPVHLHRAIREARDASAVIVESVDAWISNRLMDVDPTRGEAGEHDDQLDRRAMESLERALVGEASGLVQAHRRRRGSALLLLVTLEAGMGVVPPYPLGRAFRDLLGQVNAVLAGYADRVYLLVAGLPVDVKRLSQESWIQHGDLH